MRTGNPGNPTLAGRAFGDRACGHFPRVGRVDPFWAPLFTSGPVDLTSLGTVVDAPRSIRCCGHRACNGRYMVAKAAAVREPSGLSY
jgi:hypothetical protein